MKVYCEVECDGECKGCDCYDKEYGCLLRICDKYDMTRKKGLNHGKR